MFPKEIVGVQFEEIQELHYDIVEVMDWVKFELGNILAPKFEPRSLVKYQMDITSTEPNENKRLLLEVVLFFMGLIIPKEIVGVQIEEIQELHYNIVEVIDH